ncbi:unnamed protein product [Tuber melanosporum]|uniref:(Perigord truffle) hypothetical protein n=1 Tax=Tuber melanosporum (strain Mel28) TaxID=656061 RepID=D5GFR1_TUBMM|nr:uncharacterized protein GSTUM_00007014001 [Tuber melanosporum]CAZ83354.1 unnamed protein product [Tuber melanosporum]
MSNYLWRYYLENDVGKFQRLLAGSASSSYSRGASGSSATGLTTNSPALSKQHQPSSDGKPRPGSPPTNIVITKQSLKELDTFGRTILHLACSTSDSGGLPFVEALLTHPLTDPCIQDLESGWTALHRALYHGNISAARAILSNNLSTVKVKDHAGDSPFEVFEASVHGIEKLFLRKSKSVPRSDNIEGEDEILPGRQGREASHSDDEGGDEIFAFGSNKNLTLGFPDGDDRSYPERVPIQRSEKQLLQLVKDRFHNTDGDIKELLGSTTLFAPLRILDVQLSKLHTAVLTSDLSSNLYVCGFGRGGRLGFGDEQTQFTLRPLASPLFPKRRVIGVALGLDHTVVVFDEGDVWTWGSNTWGQLGYIIQRKTPQDEPIQTTPRQVFGPLKRERVIGCAASRIHTALVTDNSLFTFGKNDGQLGILDSLDTRTLASQTTPRKVAATFLTVSSKICDVAAIDKATAVLLNNEEVWILANFGYYKLKLPFQRGLYRSPVSQFSKHSGGHSLSKITGGGDTLCVLSVSGDIFTLDAGSFVRESAGKGPRTGKITTVRAWSLKKEHMAARDVDVGHDGSIILCTKNGSVWRRVERVKRKENRALGIEGSRYKFERVPGLTKIVVIRSNNFGAYAAIRRDPNVMKTGLLVDDHMLWKDLGPLLPFTGAFGNRKQPDDSKDKIQTRTPPRTPEGYVTAVKWFMSSSLKSELREYLSYPELSGSEDCDVLVSTSNCPEINIPAHKVFLAARSPVLRNLFVEGAQCASDVGEFTPSTTPEEKARLVFKDIKLQTLLILLYYVYADSLVDIWNQNNIHHSRMQHYRVIRSELSSISSLIGLDHLAKALEVAPHPSCSMNRDFSNALLGPSRSKFEESADMMIELANGESMLAHSVIMKARCPFFKALYGSSGRWLIQRREQGIVKVDMKHISKPVMDMVVNWLYSDWGVEGFDGVKVGKESGKVEEFIDFVLEVLSVANELILGRLCQVCQKILGRYVNTRNAAYMLTALAGCSENGFKDMCMQYICLNMETMLENHLLDELDADLMMDLDGVVKSVQRQLFPHSRTGVQEELLRGIYPDMHEIAAKEKEALIASYLPEGNDTATISTSFKNSRVGSYAGTLTPFGSPHAQKAKIKASKESIRIGASPTTEPHAGGEMIFDMDGEGSGIGFALEVAKAEETGLRNAWASPGTPSKATRTGWYPSPASSIPRASGGWVDVKGKSIGTPSSNPDLQLLAGGSPRSHELPTPTKIPTTPSKPWGASPILLGDKKLDMKEIMKQASSSRKSNLSTGLSSEGKLAPAKLSQKERKRQAALVAAASSELAVSTEIETPSTSSAKPAWATASTSARVSLKEVLDSEISAPAPPNMPTPQMLKQRTGDGGGRAFNRMMSTTTPSAVPPTTPTAQTTRSSPPIPGTYRPRLKTATPTTPPQPALLRRSVSTTPIDPTPKLSLADIISQEEAHKEVFREHTAKRSLQEIQEEQEFMRWWDAECERVRLETAVAPEGPVRRGSMKSNGRGGGGGDPGDGQRGGSVGGIAGEGTGGGHSNGSARGKGRRGRSGGRTGGGGSAEVTKVGGPSKRMCS